MIDEELYQQAAEELNSERRRPHIWARACALANDDHDEARYLYTNLRVEELLAERSSAANRTKQEEESGRNMEMSSLEDLELEPVDFPSLSGEDEEPPASARSGVDARSEPLPDPVDDGTLQPSSERAPMTFDLDENRPLDLDPDEVARLNADEPEAAAASDGRPRSDAASTDPLAEVDDFAGDPIDPFDPPGEVGTPAGTIRADEPTGSGEPLGAKGVDEPATTEAVPASERPETTPLSDELVIAGEAGPLGTRDGPFADTDSPRARTGADERLGAGASAAADVAAFEGELDDTADVTGEISGSRVARTGETEGGGDADPRSSGTRGLDDLGWIDNEYRAERQALATPPAVGSDTGDNAFTRELERQAGELPGGHDSGTVIAHEQHTGAVSPDGPPAADRGDTIAVSGDEPLELADDEGDEEYAVFARPGKRSQAVRQGSSWGALLWTLPWLLYRHLFGTAIVYALLAVVVLGGLLVTGLAWFDAGAATPLPTRIACGSFAVLALVGLVIVPFRRANHWREDKLERRGFELISYVRAGNARRAVAVAREATKLAR